MKVDKNGKVKLTGVDHRVGNFVFSSYRDYVSFTDINRTVQAKVSKRTFLGRMLEEAVKVKSDTFLHNYGGVLYYLLGIAPDQEFILDAWNAAQACLERHPELYGKTMVTPGDDAEALTEVEEMREFEESASRLGESDGAEG